MFILYLIYIRLIYYSNIQIIFEILYYRYYTLYKDNIRYYIQILYLKSERKGRALLCPDETWSITDILNWTLQVTTIIFLNFYLDIFYNYSISELSFWPESFISNPRQETVKLNAPNFSNPCTNIQLYPWLLDSIWGSRAAILRQRYDTKTCTNTKLTRRMLSREEGRRLWKHVDD